MECEEFLEGYSDFLDGELGEPGLTYYRSHLFECRRCAEYDRVMRRGLRLVRELDPPEARCEIVPLLEPGAVDRRGRQRTGELGRAAAVAGLAAASLAVVAALPMLRPGGRAVELPPVVVETPGGLGDRASLWGPPPMFAPGASFLRAPDFPRDPLLLPRAQPLSLFRTRPPAPQPPQQSDESAAE